MKNVLVTGCSKGLGKAISVELEKKGFNCIKPTRSELDLNSVESINNYFKNFNEPIYGLINNAGINILKKIEEIDDTSLEEMININLVSPLKLIQQVVPFMKKNNEGKIVNISSIWGVRSKEYRTLYSMTKFGLNGLTKSLSRELGSYNILVNSVAPGYMNTEMTKKNIPEDEAIKIKENIALKRFAEPSEVAKAIVFLLSEENSYITGQTLIVDGGFLA